MAVLAPTTSIFSPSSTSSLNYATAANNTSQQLQQQQSQGTFGGIVTPNNVISASKNLTSTGQNGTGIFTGITNSVNSFGASNLGFGFGGTAGTGSLASETVSPALAAADAAATPAGAAGASLASPVSEATASSTAGSLTGASLTGTLGAAGIGALAGNFLGKIGGNSTGGAIGGGVGAGIGMAVGGPVGAVVGGLIGGIGGGFFGNSKPSDSTEVGGLNFTTGAQENYYAQHESDTGSKFSQANADIRNTAQNGASSLVQFLNQNGATLKQDSPYANTNMILKVGSRDGMQVGFQGDNHALNYVNTAQSSGDFFNNINNTVLSQYNIPPDLQAKLNTMNLGSFYGEGDSNNTNSSSTPNTPNISMTDDQFANYMQKYKSGNTVTK